MSRNTNNMKNSLSKSPVRGAISAKASPSSRVCDPQSKSSCAKKTPSKPGCHKQSKKPYVCSHDHDKCKRHVACQDLTCTLPRHGHRAATLSGFARRQRENKTDGTPADQGKSDNSKKNTCRFTWCGLSSKECPNMDCHFHQTPGAGSAKDIVVRLEDEIKQGLQDSREALSADISQAVETAPELAEVLAPFSGLADEFKDQTSGLTLPVSPEVDAVTAIVPESWEDYDEEKHSTEKMDRSTTSSATEPSILPLSVPSTPVGPPPTPPPSNTTAATPAQPSTLPAVPTPPVAGPGVAVSTPPPIEVVTPPETASTGPRKEKRVIFTNHAADKAKPSLRIRAKHYVQKKTILGKATTTILRNNPSTYAIEELSERTTDGDETYRWFWQAARCANPDTITTNVIDLVKGMYTHATEALVYPELAELVLGNKIFQAYRLFDEVNGQIKKNVYSGINRLFSEQKAAYPDTNVFMSTKCHVINQVTILAYTERSFLNKPFTATAKGSTQQDFHKGVRTIKPSPHEPLSASGP